METVTERVDKVFAQWDRPDSPGCALAVIRDGAIIYGRGYGSAHLEHGVPITPSTVFHVASVSKQFTAFAVLLLAQQGKLSLTDDVRTCVPELPDYGHTIQVHHLIHHTSGLRDQWDLLHLAGWREDDLKTNADVLYLASRQSALNFVPGDEFVYSNTGYTLMGVIVERLSGQSLRDFTATNIFAPLDMKDTHFHDDHRIIVRNRASAYVPRNEGGFAISIPAFDTVGATSLFTTVEDLAKWDQNFYDKRVGGQALIQQLLTPSRLNNGEPIEYACGLAVGAYRGLRTVQHSGGDAGYRSHFLEFPDQRFSVVILCNLSTMVPANLARQVAAIYLGDLFTEEPDAPTAAGPIHVSEDELSSIVGVYHSHKTEQTLRLELREGKLFLASFPSTFLTPVSLRRFRATGFPLDVVYTPPSADVAATVHLPDGSSKPVVFTAVEAARPTAARLAEYAGTYRCADLDVDYRVAVRDDNLVLLRRKWNETPLTPTFAERFAFEHADIAFVRDARGHVGGFRLYTGRTRHLWFERAM